MRAFWRYYFGHWTRWGPGALALVALVLATLSLLGIGN